MSSFHVYGVGLRCPFCGNRSTEIVSACNVNVYSPFTEKENIEGVVCVRPCIRKRDRE